MVANVRICRECGVGEVDPFWNDDPDAICDTCAVNWVYHNIDRFRKRTHKDAAYSESNAVIDASDEI
jgi:hypothetical protein